MKILNLYFSAIDESQFNVIAKFSNGRKVEGRSILPFFETKTKWRTTLIKILESISFSRNNFEPEEITWMLQEGLLKSDCSDFSADYLKKIGRSLYDSLFPTGEVRDLLKGAITSAGQEQLHIQIEFNAKVTKLNRLPDYPWEMVYDGVEKKFLVDRNITFSRCIADQSEHSTLLPVNQINVLLISSGAFDLKNGLAALSEEEHKAVREGLEKSQAEGHIRLHEPERASFKSLTTYLTEHRGNDAPHVLHFDGHGVFGKRCDKCRTFHDDLFLTDCTNTKCLADLPPFQGYLLFEPDDDNHKSKTNYVSSDELGRLLQSIRSGDNEAQKGGVRLAVLSACKSAYALGASSVFNGVAQNLIGYGVPAVVAMQYTVSVKSATAFAERFYRELGNKQSLAVATSQGRVAMQNEEHNQWYRLIFYLRWQANDGGQLFADSKDQQDPIARSRKLEEMYRDAIVSCKSRFLSIIRDEQKAEDLTEDLSLGLPPANLVLQSKKLFILTGDFGVGKTLIVQRIFQNAIKEASVNSNAQIPIYLDKETWNHNISFQSMIDNAADKLGDIKNQGALIIIDELDKFPINLARKIISDSFEIVDKSERTTVIITSRPIPNIIDNYKENSSNLIQTIQTPLLSSEQSHRLIERVSGQKLDEMRLRYLEEAIKEVVNYPLFTLLLGRYWRDTDVRPIPSRTDLLSNLIKDALGESLDRYQPQLIKLAIRCIEFGNKPVPFMDLNLSRSEKEILLESKLVVEQSGGLTFPLSIFTQWFAYLGLEKDPSRIKEYLQDNEQLENWRYPLIITVGVSDNITISKILTLIAQKHPAFAAEIVRSGLSNSMYSLRLSVPPPLECGRNLREAMSVWVAGIGRRLANLIAPIREDGTLCPVGVVISHDNFLESGWYIGNEKVDNEQKLPFNFFDDDSEIDNWGWLRGRRPIHQSAWAWMWTLDTLRASLAFELSTVSLPISRGVLTQEGAWRAALAIFQKSYPNLHQPEKIAVSFLTEAMSQIDKQISPKLHEIHYITDKEQKFCLRCLREEIELMKANNISDFSVAYTSVDQIYIRRGWDNDPNKITNLKKRVVEVYKAALDEYQKLSKMWFENLLPEMQIAGMLPARLIGVFKRPVQLNNTFGNLGVSPKFYWYLEPLPKNSQNIVDIQFSEDTRNDIYRKHNERSSIVVDKIKSLRHNSSVWLSSPLNFGYLDKELSSNAPVTILVYSWLEKDLRAIGWIDERIKYKSRLFM